MNTASRLLPDFFIIVTLIAKLRAVLLDERLGLPQGFGRADIEERRFHHAYFERAALRQQPRKHLLLETQRPLATVVVGGLITSTFLTLVLLPVIYEWMEMRRQRDQSASASQEERTDA